MVVQQSADVHRHRGVVPPRHAARRRRGDGFFAGNDLLAVSSFYDGLKLAITGMRWQTGLPRSARRPWGFRWRDRHLKRPARFLHLYIFPYRHMMAPMARAATTSDVFNAIAEPQRREILVLLRAGERPVTELAQELGMTQPGASKHLRVLRDVGLVRDRKAGKQRLYGLDARGLRPVHEWTGGFERFWNESFDRLDEYVQDLKQARQEE